MKLSRIGAAALCAAALLALPSTASGASTNLNSCQYSYDSYWRDMDVTMSGSPVPTAGAGVSLQSPSISAALPAWLAQYGYNFQLLKAGYNEIPVQVWYATRATNTVEGTQVFSFETMAGTDITTAGSTFVSATPIEYEVPSLAAQAWTRRGGPVQFRQAGSGSLPPLPIGPGGRLQQPKGSLVISASLGAGITLTLDCVSGSFIADGSERVETTAAPFAAVDAPAMACLSALPTTGVRLEMADELTLARAYTGQPYSYAPAVSYRLTNAYLRSLFDAGRLTVGDNALSLTFTSAVDGAGARAVLGGPTLGPVTVRVGAGGTPIRVFAATSAGTIVESDELVGAARLNAWNGLPTGASFGFASAGPGALGAITVEGVTGAVRPYGSLYARATIDPAGASGVNRLSYDCVSGTVTTNAGVAYSELGDQPAGDQGRYTIAAYPLDPFAVAHVEPPVTPKPVVTPVPTVTAPAPTPTLPPPPTVTPAPKAGVAGVASKSLKVKSNRISAALSCTGQTTCRGTVVLRSAVKVKRKFVTLTKSVKYTVVAGKRVTVRLTLSSAGKKYVRGKKRLSVVLDVKPALGKTISKKLTLSR